ncbi:MAG: hypothetical protein RJA09_888, partial [Pseudomonadota bacterium]
MGSVVFELVYRLVHISQGRVALVFFERRIH